jgi:peptide/nickel transport system permease protein
MASLMMGAIELIVGNLLADLLLEAVEPRIKLEELKY